MRSLPATTPAASVTSAMTAGESATIRNRDRQYPQPSGRRCPRISATCGAHRPARRLAPATPPPPALPAGPPAVMWASPTTASLSASLVAGPASTAPLLAPAATIMPPASRMITHGTMVTITTSSTVIITGNNSGTAKVWI